MKTAVETTNSATYLQTATFYVDDLLVGVPIDRVQEINRLTEVTTVPHAPSNIRGVINLRGEVVTVVDLRKTLGLSKIEVTPKTRNVIIQSEGQLIGLQVDCISDILSIPVDEIDQPPANVNGVDGRHFRGVYAIPTGIVVLLDVDVSLSD